MDLKSKIILISGPTASGKSSFAIKVAKKVDGEIINADSMQVYKELKILSARPDPKEYQKIKHHLYGFYNVTKNFSTGDWLKLVLKKIEEVKKFTKKSLTEWFKNTKSNYLEDHFFKVYIDFPRQELIERINVRTREMIENGAIKEVKDFIKLRVRKDKSANKAIGVNEITEYLKKQKNLNDTRDKIAIKTRQYAKRQSTWARGNMRSWTKLKPQDINNFLKKI